MQLTGKPRLGESIWLLAYSCVDALVLHTERALLRKQVDKDGDLAALAAGEILPFEGKTNNPSVLWLASILRWHWF